MIVEDRRASAMEAVDARLKILRDDLDQLPSKAWVTSVLALMVTVLAVLIVAIVRFIPHAG
ncbi:hypothetical protein [Sphingomonas sp.]|jgi:hypothetical protein|uniref:hypothetical protein n=1 Tax=Sphingomonas sp. TaxID=28214 RepID=UPI002639F186|nr:hypothetical protein [Sphingomonas sp.]